MHFDDTTDLRRRAESALMAAAAGVAATIRTADVGRRSAFMAAAAGVAAMICF
jgi:hypothetical protein